MILKLTRAYIEDHMQDPAQARALHAPENSAPTVDQINDAILAAAREQLGEGEVDELEVRLIVTPRDMGPKGGCITFKTPIMDWHVEYKGNKPGKG